MATIDDLTAKWEPRLRAAFLKAISDIVNRVNISEIERLIRQGDIEGAVRAVGLSPMDFVGLQNAITDTFDDGGSNTESNIPKLGRIEFRFDIRNAVAEEITRTQSGTLITGNILADQLDAIRNHLTEGVIAGDNPRQTALELVGRKNTVTGQREGGVIGLTSSQEAWQRKYAGELLSSNPDDLANALTRNLRDKRYDAAIRKAIATGKPIPAATREKMMMAYRNRSLKYRADTIARTETIKALAQSQTEAYRQAIENGNVAREDIKRYWVTAGDERVRHTHRLIPGINPDGVGWDEPFKVPLSEDGSGYVMHAPHGVQCRCREKIVIDYFSAVRNKAREFA